MRRSTTGLCGVLAIDKPYGMTSHDVVDRVRRITGERRVGHAGTLDPAATGLMFIGVGAATRLSSYLTGHDKAYRARVVFGACTDTDDAQGRIIGRDTTGEPGAGVEALECLDSACVVSSLVGDGMQIPPAYSAIKRNGVVAYRAAREGSTLELEPRSFTVYEAVFEGAGHVDAALADGADAQYRAALPYWDIRLRVSKGTYIRSIARDLGLSLGCGAHLGSLRRISVADYGVERACSLEDLEGYAARGKELPWCDPAALLGFPVHALTDDEAADVANGKKLALQRDAGYVSCVARDKLMAVYEGCGAFLRPATVIPGGVAGVC